MELIVRLNIDKYLQPEKKTRLNFFFQIRNLKSYL